MRVLVHCLPGLGQGPGNLMLMGSAAATKGDAWYEAATLLLSQKHLPTLFGEVRWL